MSDIIVVGNRIWERCPACGKLVRHKALFGTLHVCLTDAEIAYRHQLRDAQLNAQPTQTVVQLLDMLRQPISQEREDQS